MYVNRTSLSSLKTHFLKSYGKLYSMKKETTVIDFGKKLIKFRKAKGLTQQRLADMIGVSRRVIAYYEGETKYPPVHFIVPLAKALNITTDELLGVKKTKEMLDNRFAALWRRLKILETFCEKDKRAVLQVVNVIVEKNKAQQKSNKKIVN